MLTKLLNENEFVTVFFCKCLPPLKIYQYSYTYTLYLTYDVYSTRNVPIDARVILYNNNCVMTVYCNRRKRRTGKCRSTVEAGDHRRRDEQHGHHVRQNGRCSLCAQMGCYQAAGHSLLPE